MLTDRERNLLRFPTRPAISWEFEYVSFLNEMINRIVVGFVRYGPPRRDGNYLSRLRAELAAYERTGNREHLRNIANYAALEDYKPQHPRSHLNTKVKSVTRRTGERRNGDEQS